MKTVVVLLYIKKLLHTMYGRAKYEQIQEDHKLQVKAIEIHKLSSFFLKNQDYWIDILFCCFQCSLLKVNATDFTHQNVFTGLREYDYICEKYYTAIGVNSDKLPSSDVT